MLKKIAEQTDAMSIMRFTNKYGQSKRCDLQVSANGALCISITGCWYREDIGILKDALNEVLNHLPRYPRRRVDLRGASHLTAKMLDLLRKIDPQVPTWPLGPISCLISQS